MRKLLASLTVSLTLLGLVSSSVKSVKANEVPAYEVRIITKRPNHVYSPYLANPGHAVIALFNEKGELVKTKGMWMDGVQPDNTNDKNMAKGTDCGWWGCIWRGAKVTKERGEWIINSVATVEHTNCKEYNLSGHGYNACNCVTFATKVWTTATANQESFWEIDPQSLAVNLASRNATYGRYLDNGNVWR